PTLPIDHMIPAGRIRRCPALLQPHISIRAGNSSPEGRLDGGERQILRGSPELWREFAQEKLTVVARYLQDPVGQWLTTAPPPIRPAPIYPVVVDSSQPEGAIGQHTPAVQPAQHAT